MLRIHVFKTLSFETTTRSVCGYGFSIGNDLKSIVCKGSLEELATSTSKTLTELHREAGQKREVAFIFSPPWDAVDIEGYQPTRCFPLNKMSIEGDCEDDVFWEAYISHSETGKSLRKGYAPSALNVVGHTIPPGEKM